MADKQDWSTVAGQKPTRVEKGPSMNGTAGRGHYETYYFSKPGEVNELDGIRRWVWDDYWGFETNPGNKTSGSKAPFGSAWKNFDVPTDVEPGRWVEGVNPPAKDGFGGGGGRFDLRQSTPADPSRAYFETDEEIEGHPGLKGGRWMYRMGADDGEYQNPVELSPNMVNHFNLKSPAGTVDQYRAAQLYQIQKFQQNIQNAQARSKSLMATGHKLRQAIQSAVQTQDPRSQRIQAEGRKLGGAIRSVKQQATPALRQSAPVNAQAAADNVRKAIGGILKRNR